LKSRLDSLCVEPMRRSAFFGLSVLLLGSSLVAAGCSDDDPADGAVGGSGGGGSGAAGSGAGTGGAAGSAGAAGSGGTGGSAGSSAGGAAGSGRDSSGGVGGSAGDAPDAGAAGDSGAAGFTLSSPAFDNNAGCGPGDSEREACDLFPVENAGLGDGTVNVSPEIEWTGVPAGTQSFAIALHDLVFIQNGSPFTHWVMWNIPGTATGLPANLPRAAMPGVPAANTQQVNYLADDDGFAGSGACGNVYEFVLYALDTATFTPANAGDQNAVQNELDASDAVLGTTTMRARSNPDGPCNVVP
jgi:Raf kinase inhibitor-like YbhB/YbcL family protein